MHQLLSSHQENKRLRHLTKEERKKHSAKTAQWTEFKKKKRSETHWTWILKRRSETQWTWIPTEDLKNTTCIKSSLQLLWWWAKRHQKLHQKVMHVQVNTPWLKMQYWCSQWSRMQCMVLGSGPDYVSNKLMYNISNNWISEQQKLIIWYLSSC